MNDSSPTGPAPVIEESDRPGGGSAAIEVATSSTHAPASVVPVSAVPSAPGDGHNRFAVLRAMTISTRLLLLTLFTVLTSVVVCLAAIWGLNGLDRIGRQQIEVSDAIRLNGDAISQIRQLATSDQPASSDLEKLSDLAQRTTVNAQGHVEDSLLASTTAAHVALTRNLDNEERLADLLDEAVQTRLELADALVVRRTVLADDATDRRRTTMLVVLGALILGALVTYLTGRRVVRSIVDPALAVGRTIRRFGDGDVTVRAPVEPDEIGLVARSFNVMAEGVGLRVTTLSEDAQRGAHLRRIADAFDVAASEREVQQVVGRALGLLTPGMPAELLITDSTSSRLHSVASNPSAPPPACPVGVSSECVAMRRARAVVFDGPESINACPHLVARDRPCSAACVPVSVNGHLLGVLHATGPVGAAPGEEIVDRLEELAGQAGSHIGALRTLEATRIQASTDGLTGLPNRRMLEARLSELMLTGSSFVLAVADIDNFKTLNDTYGHEVGDRALQVFAKVLEQNVRGHDLVARYGGEEFVLVYPEMTVKPSMEVIDRIRAAITRDLEDAGLPAFTVSFGVTHSGVGNSVEEIIRIADAGLLMAKTLGRNRVVYSDADLAAEVFGGAWASPRTARTPRRNGPTIAVAP